MELITRPEKASTYRGSETYAMAGQHHRAREGVLKIAERKFIELTVGLG